MTEKTRLAYVNGFDIELYKKIYPILGDMTLTLFLSISHDLELITENAKYLSIDARLSPLEIYAKTGRILGVSMDEKSTLEVERTFDMTKVYVPFFHNSRSNSGKGEIIPVIIRYDS